MVQETQSSNRTLILAVVALLFAIIVVGIILVLVLGGGGDSGEGATLAESAKLMPADSFMFVSLNPHLDQAKNFEVIDRVWGDNPLIKEGLAEVLSSMGESDLDYKTDIESWLGNEIAFGIGGDLFTMLGDSIEGVFENIEGSLSGVPGQLPQVSEPSEMPTLVLAVATKDQAASDKFLEKLRAEVEKSGATLEETEYKGIKIIHQEPEMAYATVDNYVVLTAGGLASMQEVIDARDGDNLADSQSYKDVLDKLPADQVSYGFIDIGAYMEVMMEAAGPGLAELPSELFDPEMFKAFQGVGFSVGFDPKGLRADFAIVYDKDAFPEDFPTMGAISNKSSGRVPAGTLFYASGGGLGNIIQMGLDAIMAMPDQPPDIEEQMQMLTGLLGVSVDELVEMLSGEFALAITHDPAGIGGDPSIPIGASFLMEAKDQEKFEKLLRSVSALLTMGAEMEFPTQTINDVEVTTIPNPDTGGMIAGWGVGEGFFAIGTSQELLEAAFDGAGTRLDDDATYKEAIAPLPKENSGILYVNVGGLFDIVVEAMSPWDREDFDQQARPLLEPIKAISAASSPFDKDKGSNTGTFFILIEGE